MLLVVLGVFVVLLVWFSLTLEFEEKACVVHKLKDERSFGVPPKDERKPYHEPFISFRYSEPI